MLTFEATPRMPTGAILAALREATQRANGELTPALYRRHKPLGAPSLKVIYARFGSWGAAMKAARL